MTNPFTDGPDWDNEPSAGVTFSPHTPTHLLIDDPFGDDPKTEDELREDLRAAAREIIRDGSIPLSAAAIGQRVPGSSYSLAEEVCREFDAVPSAQPANGPDARTFGDGRTDDPVKGSQKPVDGPGHFSGRDGNPEPKKAPQASKKTTRNGKEIPSPVVPTREPKNQAEHMNKIMRSRKLREKPSAQHVAFALSQFMWSEHGRSYGKQTEATRQFIAELTGLSINGADNAIRFAVEAGFFRRLDNGLGGKGARNRATYVPTVPDYS